jgi:hypothetical protein
MDRKKTGWWFGTFLIFPNIGNNHPNWLIFFRGLETTNQKKLATWAMNGYFLNFMGTWMVYWYMNRY